MLMTTSEQAATLTGDLSLVEQAVTSATSGQRYNRNVDFAESQVSSPDGANILLMDHSLLIPMTSQLSKVSRRKRAFPNSVFGRLVEEVAEVSLFAPT